MKAKRQRSTLGPDIPFWCLAAMTFLAGCNSHSPASGSTLTSIAVAPPNPTIAKGTTQQFAATGTFSDGGTQNLTSQVTWTSLNTSVATISSAGLASGVGTGSTTIQASLNGVVGSTLLTVTAGSGFAGVFTQHNDNARTGQNLNESVLTPSNVNASSFGKLFSQPVDGFIYAQPLYVPNVTIAGKGTHNVLYVATEGDSVYAFDADNNTGGNSGPLWHVSLIDMAHGAMPGETTLNSLIDLGCSDIVPQVGITSTPVIDPSTRTMYVEARSKKPDETYLHRLHMLDITTGAEKSPGPAVITATAPGTSDGGTTVTFDPLYQHNRPGLLLVNGTVYLGYASLCDFGVYHGWIFAYSASTLTQTAVFLTTPNQPEGEGGIWMSGAGIAADTNGNIFTATGNGSFSATDFGDSILKLVLNGHTISVRDYFTPFDQGSLDPLDWDLGSGGVVLLPDQPGHHQHELVQAGKGGTIYLIDRDQMTVNDLHYCSDCTSDPEIVEEIQNAGAAEWLFATPAYWNNTVYFCGKNDVLKAYSLTSGLLGVSPSSSSTTFFRYPGATPAISANGATNGIVWAIDSNQFHTPGPAVLHAYDATNVANELYNSAQMGSRDRAGNAVKFTVPTIANGKVYIGTSTEVDVYGLLSGSDVGARLSPTSAAHVQRVHYWHSGTHKFSTPWPRLVRLSKR